MRIDKYVWCVRLAKTRSLATKLVAGNKIKLNGLECKPAKDVSAGDLITCQKNNALFSFKVLQLIDKRLGAKLVSEYITDQTTQEELDKYKTYQTARSLYRSREQGKPSKKDRRDLDDFLEGW